MTTQQVHQTNSLTPFALKGSSGFLHGNVESLRYCEVFEALGHETRLRVFDFIYRAGEKGARPKDIINCYGVDSGTLDFHLKRLMAVGLIVLKSGCLRGTYSVSPNLPLGLTLMFDSRQAQSHPSYLASA
jgi:DNA-binding transcriptional ArsR family regulator